MSQLSCLSWKWRKRSSVEITERTYEERTKAFQWRRESSHFEAVFYAGRRRSPDSSAGIAASKPPEERSGPAAAMSDSL